MNVDTLIEILKNNRNLWVSVTITGFLTIVNSIVLNAQRKKQFNYDKKIENYKNEYRNELEVLKNDFNTKTENYKSILEKKNYISKIKFDTEFALYKDLWSACRKMVNDVYFIYPTFANIPADIVERKKYEQNIYDNAHSSFKYFIEQLGSNAPFISLTIYTKFEDIGRLCKQNIDLYEAKWNAGYLFDWEGSPEKHIAEREAYKRTDEFNIKYKKLIEDLRTYLNKLDVNEQEGIYK